MQKRGEIVDADDFLPVANSYPVHPSSLIKVPHTTTAAMLEERKLHN